MTAAHIIQDIILWKTILLHGNLQIELLVVVMGLSEGGCPWASILLWYLSIILGTSVSWVCKGKLILTDCRIWTVEQSLQHLLISWV